MITCLAKTNILCFVHLIFSSFGFWYFGHFSCMIFFLGFFRLAHLTFQVVNKDQVIFLYFHNSVANSDQTPKTKNGMNKSLDVKSSKSQANLTKTSTVQRNEPIRSIFIVRKGSIAIHHSLTCSTLIALGNLPNKFHGFVPTR